MNGRVERIDQVIPSFAAHDAIGSHALQLRRLLRAEGFESDIWAEALDPRLAGEARDYRECPRRQDRRVLLYQLSTHSAVAGWLAGVAAGGGEVWADYHNITPAGYFARWEPEAAESMVAARRELHDLATVVRHSLAVSRFNEQELIDAGYAATRTAPLLVDLSRYHDAPDPATVRRLARRRERGGTSWLFVGRLAPNKCQHDVVGAFAVHRRLFDPAAHLTLVGGATSPRYARALRRLATQLGLDGSVDVLDGGVGAVELLAHFAAADVFVCLSEHEGFCVPILEAFELGVPVVAYRAAAVPETVGEAGLLLDDKDPLAVATAVESLRHDPQRRAALVAAGRARARAFDLPASSARTLAAVTDWVGG